MPWYAWVSIVVVLIVAVIGTIFDTQPRERDSYPCWNCYKPGYLFEVCCSECGVFL